MRYSTELNQSSVRRNIKVFCIAFFKILAMIEEAAGTRMYECKKIAVQKTIEKKESKLENIQTVLRVGKYTFFHVC